MVNGMKDMVYEAQVGGMNSLRINSNYTDLMSVLLFYDEFFFKETVTFFSSRILVRN